MIRLPWQHQETRQDIDVGDALLTAIFNQAQGSTGLVRSRIGAVAAAAGWWARAFASAELTPGVVANAFGPALRVTLDASLYYAVRPYLSSTARAVSP